MKRNPELVEKNDPPITTKIIKIKSKLDCSELIEKPILDILLATERKLSKKLLLKLKKRKKNEITIMK